MSFESLIAGRAGAVAELRRRLHRIPELNYEEAETASVIRAELDRLAIRHVDGVKGAPTATIAWIGDASKKCVALRADIDGLPIEERTGVAHASVHAGRMHACGHDGHMATLVGVAEVLKSVEEQLPVCVKLIFQPAEEGGGGAQRLVEAGVLDGRIGPKVQAIFGLHGWPGMKVGLVASKPGVLLAATDNFAVTFVGKGCHGAYPQLGRDPIVAAAEAVVNLQQVASRDSDPTEPVVVTVGMIQGGTAVNVIPDSATIQGTARTLTEAARLQVRAAMARRCQGVAVASGCEARFQWYEGYPPTVNDSAMAEYVSRVARQALGEDRFLPVSRPSMGGRISLTTCSRFRGASFWWGRSRRISRDIHLYTATGTTSAMGRWR